METKNREKLLLICVVAAIGLYVFNMVVIDPLTASWRARRDSIAKLTTEIAEAKSRLTIAKAIEDKWSQMRTNTLPDNVTAAESKLFTAFQGWEMASGVTPVSHHAEMMEPEDQYATFKNESFHVDVTGNLNQIFNFLYKVESSPMGLKVDSIALSSRDDQGRQLALGLGLSGLILVQPTNSASQ